MKEYDKEKLHEYAKELFALCLEKGLPFIFSATLNHIGIYTKEDEFKRFGSLWLNSDHVHEKYSELIEKVKAL